MMKSVMTKTKNAEMCLEMLGIMANAKIGKEWTDVLLSNDKFIDFLEKTMVNGVTEDDILTETLALIANVCQEAECCSLIERTYPVIQNSSSQYSRSSLGKNMTPSSSAKPSTRSTVSSSIQWVSNVSSTRAVC
jgi:hypothetical protein